MKRFVLLLLQIVFLPCLALYVSVSALTSRRRRALRASYDRIALVTPFGAGTKSGSARAERDLVEMLGSDFELDVIGLRDLEARPGFFGSVVARLIGSALPMERPLASFVADPSPVISRLRDVDLVFIEFVYGGLFLFRVPPVKSPLVLRDHEVLARRFAVELSAARVPQMIGAAVRLGLVWLVTAHVYRQVDRIITLTAEDGSWLTRWFPFTRDRVVAIPVSFRMESLGDLDGAAGRADVLYAANFYHKPNVDGLLWFLSECAPKLRGNVTLHLIGLDEPLKKVSLPETRLRIVRHGHVEDIGSACAQVPIALAPLISGGGMRIKNLLFGSYAKAIVTTSLANEGIGFEHGKEAMVCDRPDEFAAAIDRLIADPIFARQLGLNARSVIDRKFSPDVIRARYATEVFAPLRQ